MPVPQSTAAAAPRPAAKPAFQWDDPLLLDEQLDEDERMVRDAARQKLYARTLPAGKPHRIDLAKTRTPD